MTGATLRGQGGYTLVELLITSAVLGMVVTGVTVVYQASLAQVNHASSQQEAQAGARMALDRVASDLKQMGLCWSDVQGAGDAVTVATPTTITFRGDIDADTVSGSAETTLTVASTATTLDVSGNAGAFNVYGTAALND